MRRARNLVLCVALPLFVVGGLLLAPTGHIARLHEALASATMPAATNRQFPVPIVELRGTSAELGTAHAQQLSGPIHVLVERYLMAHFSNAVQRFVALSAAKGFLPYLSAEHQQEAQALAGKLQMDERQVLLGQCFLDLIPMTACSTIALPADASPDGIARFGRNLDFPSLDVADKHSVLFVYRPDAGRYAFAAVGWPGMMGVLSGMNEHGLALANMEVTRPMRLPGAMPYTLLYRTVLERCRTVDEAIELLRQTPRQTANNLMLMDASGHRAVVELTPEAIHVRRGTEHAALISTNHQRAQDQDTPGRCRRYDRLRSVSSQQFGQIDAAALKRMLGQVKQGNMTLQSMVFEPATRTLYLATGKSATDHPYHRLDLKPYFAK